MNKKIHLLIIDPQRDFCEAANPDLADTLQQANGGATNHMIQRVRTGGSLFVPGADQDIARLAAMVKRLERHIANIHVTLDSHNEVDIAHPVFWINSAGEHPAPFTTISEEDVKNGTWRATIAACQGIASNYVTALAANKRYPLCIWPTHCVIGTIGCAIMPELNAAINDWARNRLKKIDYVTKGSNPFTEHYSAVKADVEDPSDPTTQLNTGLLNVLASTDEILISGQALSHCVANTIIDIADNFGEENIKKFVLLEDTCSNVPGFENLGTDFVTDMTARGMRVSNSVDYLK